MLHLFRIQKCSDDDIAEERVLEPQQPFINELN